MSDRKSIIMNTEYIFMGNEIMVNTVEILMGNHDKIVRLKYISFKLPPNPRPFILPPILLVNTIIYNF